MLYLYRLHVFPDTEQPTNFSFHGCFPVEPGLISSPQSSSSTCSGRDKWHRISKDCQQCHSTNTVKALKETNSTDPNHRKSCSRFILSSSITTLLTEGAHTQTFYGAFPELPGWPVPEEISFWTFMV